MADVLINAREAVQAELTSLRARLTQLEAADAALAGLNGDGISVDRPVHAPTPARKRGPGRPRGATPNRAEQAKSLVVKHPGIKIPQLASEMKIEPNYLYRVMPKLVSEGSVRNDNGGFFPVN